MARERGIKTSELAIAGMIVPEQMAFWNSIDEAAAAGVLDWDLILRLGNSRFDRIVETIQEPAQARRRAAQARLDLEIRKQNDESRDKLKLGIRMFFNRRDAVSESIGHSLYALFTTGLRLAAYSQDDSLVRLDLTRLGFALAAYRADHGAYPAKLADLAPKHMAKIPHDRFSDGDLHYSLQDGGYLLYSVGPNGQDDGGRQMNDHYEDGEARGDDISIRMPATK